MLSAITWFISSAAEERNTCLLYTSNPCYFGTDIDDKDKLIACKMSIEEIGKQIGVDSLGYLSVDGIKRIAEGAHCDFCTGCFTGVYPIEVPEKMPVDKFCYKISEEV